MQIIFGSESRLMFYYQIRTQGLLSFDLQAVEEILMKVRCGFAQ